MNSARRIDWQQFFDDVSGDIGDAEVSALEAVGQFFVIQTEQFQNRGVHVVNVDGFFRDPPADFVRLTNDLSALHAAARQPHAE